MLIYYDVFGTLNYNYMCAEKLKFVSYVLRLLQENREGKIKYMLKVALHVLSCTIILVKIIITPLSQQLWQLNATVYFAFGFYTKKTI